MSEKVGLPVEPAIVALLLRIYPDTWTNHIALNFELYGCANGKIVFNEHISIQLTLMCYGMKYSIAKLMTNSSS